MEQTRYLEGFFHGFLAATIFMLAVTTWVRDQGRDECDNKLPRTEKCVQVWVPEKIKEGNKP